MCTRGFHTRRQERPVRQFGILDCKAATEPTATEWMRHKTAMRQRCGNG